MGGATSQPQPGILDRDSTLIICISAANVLGRLDQDPEVLRSLAAGVRVEVRVLPVQQYGMSTTRRPPSPSLRPLACPVIFGPAET